MAYPGSLPGWGGGGGGGGGGLINGSDQILPYMAGDSVFFCVLGAQLPTSLCKNY